ncbi:N-6 DNA methylase [candidate division KSB1 bacterium]
MIQTIFYGVFSAWILYYRDKTATSNKFDWRLAGWYLKVPMIRALFERVANPNQLGRLGLIEVLDWTADTLNRVEKDIFYEKFEESEAVLYFYEPFLEAFDKELRKELGVWYTPKEIVKYMVEKVDRILRQELKIKRGLADEKVYVLDPACGTGAYLVEVLKRIHKTLKDEGIDALSGEDLKDAAMKRIFGFEILTAPFVVSHLQLGILLQNLGANFIQETDRVGVYLTNALTGWEPPNEKGKQLVTFPEMQEEKNAADQVKREKPILVILGNPPYNAFAGVSPDEEGGLIESYKQGLREKWNIGKYNLDDLYIRFFRLAERSIVEKSGKGIVCFISNFSFTYEPSFVVMREHLFNSFTNIWIDSLNGDSRETGKLTPEGQPDPSIFSTKYNKEGIRKGTAISILVKKESKSKTAKVYSREFWGKEKKIELLNSISINNYDKINPTFKNRYILRNINVSNEYYTWPSIIDLSNNDAYPAFMESRQCAIIDIEYDKLKEKMEIYFDGSISWKTLKNLYPELTKDFAGYNANKTREKLLKEEV